MTVIYFSTWPKLITYPISRFVIPKIKFDLIFMSNFYLRYGKISG